MSNQTQSNEQWKLLVLLLKEVADKEGISQDEISKKTGLLQSNISRFFSLKYRPRLDIFLSIQSAVGVDLSYIINENDFEDLIKKNPYFEGVLYIKR